MVRNKEYKRVCDLLDEAQYTIEKNADIMTCMRAEAAYQQRTIDRLKTECADMRSLVQELLCKKPYELDPYAPTVRIAHNDPNTHETRWYEFDNPMYRNPTEFTTDGAIFTRHGVSTSEKCKEAKQ